MKQIGTDFQGWPIYAKTLKEMLIGLGAKEESSGKLYFPEDFPYYDVYPRTYEDDGMGYGINERYITEATCFDADNKKLINIFVDVEDRESLRSGDSGL